MYATVLPLAASAVRSASMNRLHVRVVDRVDPLLHQVVERADQDRHDREIATAAQQVLEEDDLELDRMLGPVR